MTDKTTEVHTVTDSGGEYWAKISDIVIVALKLNWPPDILKYFDNIKTGKFLREERDSIVYFGT